MADLSIEFAGVKAPNPFWVASGPPSNTLYQLNRAFEAGWGDHPHLVCFNDECPYYARGWIWMKEQYERKVSYRHRLDPKTGDQGPLPVWSPTALRDRIIEE